MGLGFRCLALGVIAAAITTPAAFAQKDGRPIVLRAGSLALQVDMAPLRFAFRKGGTVALAPADAGLRWEGKPVTATAPRSQCFAQHCSFDVQGDGGKHGTLIIDLSPHHARMQFETGDTGARLEFRTGGLTPGYGLGDHSVMKEHRDTDITGFANDRLLADGGLVRFVSNFIIFPKQGVAAVLVDPFEKIVHSSAAELDQGVVHAQHRTEMNYYFGTSHDIYAEFRKTRNEDGYPVLTPKPALFGVGWEAFGALGWNTNQTSVRENVDRYIKEGYPLTWVVIGSGYWPKEKPFHETTSFGLFDREKYPDPATLFKHFHDENLKVLLGLRICFVIGGPFTQEGLDHGYFIARDGKPEVYHGDWPESPYYMLNAQNADALKWYLALVKRWTDFGVDGYKEDLYGYTVADTRDDKVEPINAALMRDGIYLIERTGYLSSNADLIRINDFNYDQNQDRGPVNSLAVAYSGSPLLYPTLVGGTFAENKFSVARTERMQRYMMRNAQWAALHSGIAMGEPPWSFPEPEVAKVMLSAAQLHGRLQPYLYSAALQFADDGYPWPMTPLPVAFPHDEAVYGRENDHVRGYEWMIGESLLATPIYGNDYATAMTRNVYLPAGEWMDYDTGEKYQGPRMLKEFSIPFAKTPLFVGGSGVVLELENGVQKVRVYPLVRKSTATLRLDDNGTKSVVHVNVQDWKSPRLTDATTHKAVDGAWVRHAYEFTLTKGHNYVVQ